MRFILLSLAFSAAVRAIPVPSPDDTTNEITRRDDDVFEEFSALIDSLERQIEEEKELDSDMSEDGSKYLGNDDDPAFGSIFQHVEDILDSNASANERIQSILDAIVHDKESWRDESPHEEPPSSDEIVSDIFDILGGEASSEEKIDEIFNEITKHTHHNQKVEVDLDDSEEVLLHRIDWIMNGPESAQKRVQKMLNELGNHLHPENQQESSRYEPTGKDIQETLADAEEERDSAIDIQEDAEDDGVTRELKDTVEDAVGSVWR